MTSLGAIGRRQGDQLKEFQASNEAQLLVRLARTECLLELSKLASSRLDLASFAGQVVSTILQFVPSRACQLSLEVPEIPPVLSRYGHQPDLDAASHHIPLTHDELPAGELIVAPEVVTGDIEQFIDALADQVGRTLSTLIDAERLRRRAALSQVSHLADLLGDHPSAEDLTRLVDALACLPNSLGARLEINHAAIGSVRLEAGSAPADVAEPTEVPGGSFAVSVHWAANSSPGDRDLLKEVSGTLVAALARAEEKRHLLDEAETDPLTGVGNRRRASRALVAAINLAAGSQDSVGVLYLDLDHFKSVNDNFGHSVGDEVLITFGQHLTRMVRAYDTVARLGGEEFVVICPGLSERAGAALAQRIVERTPEACAPVLPGDEWRQTVSAGVACYPDAADFADGVLRHADRALYAAKAAGRNTTRVASQIEH